MAFKMKGSPMQRNFGVGGPMEEMEKINPLAAFDPKGDGFSNSKDWEAATKLDLATTPTIGVNKDIKTGGSTVADTVSTDKKKKRKRKNK